MGRDADSDRAEVAVLDAQDDLKRDLAFYSNVPQPRRGRTAVAAVWRQYLADESQVGPLVSRFERDEPAKRGKRKEPKEKATRCVRVISAADIGGR